MTATIVSAEIPQEVHSEIGDLTEEHVVREVKPTPDRYRNAIGKYKIDRLATCASCGKCVDACSYGVHSKPDSYALMVRPQDYRCIGPECAESASSCINQCPNHALIMRLNPNASCLGDPRWPSDLILSTWHQAETGHVPPSHLEYRHGDSGGGFDRMRFKFEIPGLDEHQSSKEMLKIEKSGEIDTSLDLNHREDGRPQVHIDIPVYGGGMSFGSVSIHTILAKARCATAWNTFSCTGEGGYPDRLKPYDNHSARQDC
jgi:ferredoxin